MPLRTIDTTLALVELSTDELIRVRVKEGVKLTVAGFKQVLAARRELSGGFPRGVIALVPEDVDFELQVVNVDHYTEDDATAFTAAFAIVTGGSLFRRLLSLYVTYFKPAFPTEAFADEPAAMEWIRRFVA